VPDLGVEVRYAYPQTFLALPSVQLAAEAGGGGVTLLREVRVLWLALLPFLFANLAGWMCPAG
jgi:hypothetical protein